MTRAPLLALALLAVAFAGCLGDGGGGGPRSGGENERPAIVPGKMVEPITGNPLPGGPGHDHNDPAQHAVEVNVELAGRPDVELNAGNTYWLSAQGSSVPLGIPLAFGELDHAGDWLAQCSDQRDGAYVWSIANRTAPVAAARLATGAHCADIKLTDDANYAVVGLTGGLQLWDLRDKANPVLGWEAKDGTSCHMCFIHPVGGREYVFLSAQSNVILTTPARNVRDGGGVLIAELVRDPPEIKPVGKWMKDSVNDAAQVLPTLSERDIGHTVHDMTVYDDPLLGKPVMAAAFWDWGVWFVDVSDPANPADLGMWNDFGGDAGNVHTVDVKFLNVSGEPRRIVVAATETGGVTGPKSIVDPGWTYILDATDLAAIELKGKWTLPGRPSAGTSPDYFPVGEYSPHNLHLVQGKIYMAYYHAGVWVLDVQAFLDAGAPAADMFGVSPVPALGVFLPRNETADRGPTVWDVVVKDGFIYASDYVTGLHVLHFAGDPKFDPAYTSTA